ncbi:MAG: hypothetical protein GTN80_08750 [Nitrososphaeria archaeon]|nr:hypothetical protein [Nitrososphaeria archaeon]NIN53257.1 hypothetical protein [Nitrososphaeria archaeon]NIQ33708.1 hypothetical protein [Nitrososphaeria archaeon]
MSRLGFFFGCTTAILSKEIYEDTKKILNEAGIKYEALGFDQCCGSPLVLAGYLEEARGYAKRIVEEIQRKKIDTVITACPYCYIAFSRHYKDMDVEVPFKVKRFTQLADELLKEGRLKFNCRLNLKVTYHDPCHLGRMGDGIYEEPRNVLKSLPGIELRELELNREEATCCGGERTSFPILSIEVAKEKIESQVKPLGVDAIVSSCSFCYVNFREAAELMGNPIKVYSLEQLLARTVKGR